MPNTYDNLTTSDREMKLNSASRATFYSDSFFSSNDGPNVGHRISTAEASESGIDLNSFNLESTSNVPGIEIIVQPVDKFRFRYKSELTGPHGSLLGERESCHKEYPTVQIVNCAPKRNTIIRCTLVTADEDRFPHAHHLIRKDSQEGCKDDPHDIEVSNENNYTAVFSDLGIIHTEKRNIREEIMRKMRVELLEEKRRNNHSLDITTRENLQMKNKVETAQKWMNLNSVSLCFQGFFHGDNNALIPLTEKIYSRPINNLKSTLTGELRICRIYKQTSSCEGNEEVWLLVEKVGKKNIRVQFYEVDEKNNITWIADGRFSESDVHHQYAIVLRTPPYKDVNITKTKEVLVRLERPSDGEISNSLKFMYKPRDNILTKKRPLILSSGSLEFDQNPQIRDLLSQSSESIESNDESINLPCDNISNLSGELQKLLDLGDSEIMDLEVPKDFTNDSNLEKCSSTPVYSETNQQNLILGFSPGLTTSTASFNEPIQNDFATDIVQKVMTLLREMKSKCGSESTTVIRVRDLLTEATKYGDTPLHYSVRNEHYDNARSIMMLLSAVPPLRIVINTRNSSGETPLHLAVLKNQPFVVRALMALGADPNSSDKYGSSPLHNAIMVNACECIAELLRYRLRLNLDAHSGPGFSALHLASEIGSLYAVQSLVDAGCDVNVVDATFGRTCLHMAVDKQHKHVVEYLLANTDIDVNRMDFQGITALHCATDKSGTCAEEFFTILRKYGAGPRVRNNRITQYNVEDNNSDILRGNRQESRERPVLCQQQQSKTPEIGEVQPVTAGILRLTDEHVDRIAEILNRTRDWEKLAQHTGHGSLIKVYRRTSNPAIALFVKIRMQQPNISVEQVKKYLIDVEAFESAKALEEG